MIGLVFSKNRAMQLDAALRSFHLHCADPEEILLFVLYMTTSAIHERQYSQLKQDYSRNGLVNFVEQKQFRRDVLKLLTSHMSNGRIDIFHQIAMTLGPHFGNIGMLGQNFDQLKYLLFLVDDNTFVRSFSLKKVRKALAARPKSLGFSLRLGRNATFCYMLDMPQLVPPFTRLAEQVFCFDWTTAEGDFGYPLEISSSVYQLHELLPLLFKLPFDNPNTMEGHMAARARLFQVRKPELLCYEKSVTFCNPINRVQEVSINRAGILEEYSPEYLAKMFDDGYRIKVEAYAEFVSDACHQEMDLVFEKANGE